MTFLEDVLQDLQLKKSVLSEAIFVLPSKRAGVFLKHYLGNYTTKTVFSPEIISIEDFVQKLSGLQQIDNIELLFQFYSTYKKITPKEELETFESFSSWAQILLQDFNEIDRYLIKTDAIFDYLSAIKELDHWSKASDKTELVSNYIKFWNRLKMYYEHLSTELIQNNRGYQGLIYREALHNIESYIQNTKKQHVFIGFNALNTAEERIIQELLHSDLATIYWDAEKVFMQDDLHGASYFLKHYKNRWPYFQKHPFEWINSNYEKEKKIKIIGCSQSVGQSKYIGNILEELTATNTDLNKTAIVLGEETLLMPLLNSLPESVKSLNVTMGFPLKSVPLASLFEHLFKIHKSNTNRFYFKDVLLVLSHQMIQPLIVSYQDIATVIRSNNIVYLSLNMLKELATPENEDIISLLFEDWNITIRDTLKKCITLIHRVKNAFQKSPLTKTLELEYLYRFYKLFNELDLLNSKYNYMNDISALHNVYKELLNAETLDFQGEPLDGLQVMGMLESRVLDFETLIITSVNEGILPAGKSNNSFIPYDVKREYHLPTFKEKDAVYTYHFYRLIQRAKNIYLLYNTKIDALKGGEKSRFITQLDIEGLHHINHQIVVPQIPKVKKELLRISKDDSILKQLLHIAERGFSPSSLTNYIRNPIDFYYDKVLGIKETDNVEETIAANTLGTVIHKTLQDFYEPIKGQFLSEDYIENIKSRVDERITFHFKNLFKKGDITQGKNMIIYEVAKRYITNFLELEKKDLAKGNTIKVIAIEIPVETTINIPKINFPVTLKGEIDRIDEYNGITRIIDYKSGKVLQSDVEIIDWEPITQDYDAYSKAFQVLMYAYILEENNQIQLPVEAGIISFKNLQQGFLKFAKKESVRGQKQQNITKAILDTFGIQLHKLISEICNPDIDFIEKELNT